MKSIAHVDAVQKNKYDAAAAASGGVVTIPAVADEFHVIDSIHASFSTAPGAAETLTITIGGVTTFTQHLPAVAGRYEFLFPRGHYKRTVNQEVVITQSDPGGAVKGALQVTYR